MTDDVQNGTKDGATFADKFSAAWLAGVGLVILGGLLLLGYLVATGVIPVSRDAIKYVAQNFLVPAAWLITGLAVIELFGKQKVRALLDQWGGGGE